MRLCDVRLVGSHARRSALVPVSSGLKLEAGTRRVFKGRGIYCVRLGFAFRAGLFFCHVTIYLISDDFATSEIEVSRGDHVTWVTTRAGLVLLGLRGALYGAQDFSLRFSVCS